MGKLFGYALIAAVLLIEVPRFMGAFAGLDDTPLTAFGTAVALSGGSMYVFHTWWTSSRKLRNWLLVPFGLNLVLAGVILVPWGVSQLRDVPLASVVTGWAAWAWVSVAVLSPFVLVGGVTTALAFQKEKKKAAGRAEQLKPQEERSDHVVEMDELDRMIVQALSERPGASYQTVADAVGSKKSTVYGRAKALESAGVLGGNGRHE